MTIENESSELQSFDFALGAHLAGALEHLNAATGPKAYQEFLSRNPDKQIFRHDSPSPMQFLNAFRAAEAGAATTTDGKKINLPKLPIIVYWRKPGFTPDDQDRGMLLHEKILLHHEAGEDPEEDPEVIANLSILPVILEYKVSILAWDKLTIDKLCIALYAHLTNKAAGNHKFTVGSRIGTEIYDLVAEIMDPKAIAFTDNSMERTEGRLFAVEGDLTVNTRILFGAAVTYPDPVRFQFVLEGYIK